MRSKTIGWIGFFLYGIAAFLPIIEKSLIMLPIGGYFIPIKTLSMFIIEGDGYIDKLSFVSEVFPYLVIGMLLIYFSGLFLCGYGLLNSSRKFTRYGGILALVFVFVAYMVITGYTTVIEIGRFELWEVGWSIKIGFLAAIILLYSSTK